MFIQPAPNPNPVPPIMLEGAASAGIPSFENPNGRMMEVGSGASTTDVIVRDGRRQSVFRSYVYPCLDWPNLTVLTHAMITRLTIDGARVVGVEFIYGGKVHDISANLEVVLSLGAINTPKVLMQSGIGNCDELQRFGIPLAQHLPGVGKNFQDHFLVFGCIWEYQRPLVLPNAARAVLFAKSNPYLDTPDVQIIQSNGGGIKAEMNKRNLSEEFWWSLAPGVVRPRSRGEIRLTGPNPDDPIRIEANTLSHRDDMRAAIASVEICREIANSPRT